MTHAIRIARARRFVKPVLGFGLLVACSAHHDDGQDLGEATVAIEAAPPDVQCVRITAAGVRTVVRSMDVVPGQSTVFNLRGLPLGDVAFSGEAFPVACSTLDASMAANWLSDSILATLALAVVPTVKLTMRRNGRANVGVDFEEDDAAGGAGGSGATGAGGTGATGSGGAGATGAGGSGATGAGGTGATGAGGTFGSGGSGGGPTPSCFDNVRNGLETDIDCGGSQCPRCDEFMHCRVNSDCLTNRCISGFCTSCIAPPCP